MKYTEFLEQKTQLSGMYGFEPVHMPNELFDFQQYIITKGLQKGRTAIFTDTGTGKTFMELVFADNIIKKTNINDLVEKGRLPQKTAQKVFEYFNS